MSTGSPSLESTHKLSSLKIWQSYPLSQDVIVGSATLNQISRPILWLPTALWSVGASLTFGFSLYVSPACLLGRGNHFVGDSAPFVQHSVSLFFNLSSANNKIFTNSDTTATLHCVIPVSFSFLQSDVCGQNPNH